MLTPIESRPCVYRICGALGSSSTVKVSPSATTTNLSVLLLGSAASGVGAVTSYILSITGRSILRNNIRRLAEPRAGRVDIASAEILVARYDPSLR
jgi:hypothetical protein